MFNNASGNYHLSPIQEEKKEDFDISLLMGRIITDIAHNDNTDEGIIMSLYSPEDKGYIEVEIGYSSCEGYMETIENKEL